VFANEIVVENKAESWNKFVSFDILDISVSGMEGMLTSCDCFRFPIQK